MTTATPKARSASAELARLERANQKLHTTARAAKDKVTAWDQETEAMRWQISARLQAHLDEAEGADRRIKIEPFQKSILADYFDGARETAVLIGKKTGKSSLLGALSLFHLLTEPFAEVVVAASRDQAGVLLRQVVGYVRYSRSPAASRASPRSVNSSARTTLPSRRVWTS